MSLARPLRDRTATKRYQPEPPPGRSRRVAKAVSKTIPHSSMALPETSFRRYTIPPRVDWSFEQHRYAKTSGVNHHAGMRLYLGTDIPDASQDNVVPITTYEGQIVGADESRPDDHDFTYAHTIPNGRVILGQPKTSWGPWMNHTWDKRRVNCVIRWNNQLHCLVLFAIGPIREG